MSTRAFGVVDAAEPAQLPRTEARKRCLHDELTGSHDDCFNLGSVLPRSVSGLVFGEEKCCCPPYITTGSRLKRWAWASGVSMDNLGRPAWVPRPIFSIPACYRGRECFEAAYCIAALSWNGPRADCTAEQRAQTEGFRGFEREADVLKGLQTPIRLTRDSQSRAERRRRHAPSGSVWSRLKRASNTPPSEGVA